MNALVVQNDTPGAQWDPRPKATLRHPGQLTIDVNKK
jgi:hypothetical protein